jgi:hypothetical protein
MATMSSKANAVGKMLNMKRMPFNDVSVCTSFATKPTQDDASESGADSQA